MQGFHLGGGIWAGVEWDLTSQDIHVNMLELYLCNTNISFNFFGGGGGTWVGVEWDCPCE